jgi:ARC6-like, IMS domain/DnaJ domain
LPKTTPYLIIGGIERQSSLKNYSLTADLLMSNTASLGRSMRIPLDYYQILGVPTVATMGQIQQAYADRNLQQPRHEYTSTAIESRRKLLGDAYEVLAHPAERSQYDAAQLDANPHFPEGEHPPSTLEIADDRLLGGLLILAEIGEYEQLLSIAWPLLGNEQILKQSIGNADPEEISNSLHLTVALTLLELGREEWRQNKPAEGCQALETSIKLLRQQNIYPTVQAEIVKELAKFRPQYILSVLCAPNSCNEDRQQALSLLQELVANCSNPHGYKTYGMTQDGFIAYIDQIRRYLTTNEQQNLFEEPATQSGNPVFTYLLVYAMVARGFYYQMPELIHRAKQLLLKNLGRRQDVFIEQALCYLLLGQTQEAQYALERSQDRESLDYIRRNSATSEDLLLGLCRYSELWFQTQVFPHFADLTHHKASLQQYFDNRQVQAYLEDLPPASGDLSLFSESSGELSPFANVPAAVALPTYEVTTALDVEGQGLPLIDRAYHPTPTVPPGAGDNVVPFERPKKKTSQPSHPFLEEPPVVPAVLPLSAEDRGELAAADSHALALRPKTLAITTKRKAGRRSATFRQLLFGFGGLLGTVAAVLLISNAFKSYQGGVVVPTVKKASPPAAPTTVTPTGSNSNTAVATTPATTVQLTVDSGQKIVEEWLQAKAKSLSTQHEVQSLDNVLADPALTRAKMRARDTKQSSSYLQYKHVVKVNDVTVSTDQQSGVIDATVNEVAQFYNSNQQLDRNYSYNKNLRVRYSLVNSNGRWLIKDMTVVQ